MVVILKRNQKLLRRVQILPVLNGIVATQYDRHGVHSTVYARATVMPDYLV